MPDDLQTPAPTSSTPRGFAGGRLIAGAAGFMTPVLGYVALTAAIFAPLILHLDSGVLRGPTDGAQVIRYVWMLDRIHKSPFTAARDQLIGAPEGVPVASALEIVQPLQPAAVWLGSRLLGETVAFNLFLLAGFVLTGFATYALLHRLGISPLASFFGGAVVAFNPWMIERALEGHAALTHTWPLVLLIGALVVLHRGRSVRWAALAGATLALCFFTSAYFGLLGALVVTVFLGLAVVQSAGASERLWVLSLACVLAATTLVALLPAAVAYAHDRRTVDAIAGHGVEELSSYSADLGSYLRPAAQHPLFGKHRIETQIGSGDGERVLYFGFATLALAGIGASTVFRRRSPAPGTPLHVALSGALVLAPAALLLSFPPHVEIAGIRLPMPSALIAETTSFYRVYARFGLLFGIAVALLAAAGLNALLSDRRRGVTAAAAVLVALVVFELFPGRLPVWVATPRASDLWLARQPSGIVANYPMPTDRPAANELALEEQYLQRFHSQPLFTLISGGTGGSREQAIRIVSRYLTAPETPGILAAEGVRYVLVHDEVFREQGDDPPTSPPGLRLVGRFGNIRAFELDPTVVPANVDVVLEQQAAAIAAVQGLPAPELELGAGFSRELEGGVGPGWRRLTGEGALRIAPPDPRLKRMTLLVQAQSPDGVQEIQLLDEADEVVGQASVGLEPTTLVLGPFAVGAAGAHLRLRGTGPSGLKLLVATPTVQPLADFSISLRAQR